MFSVKLHLARWLPSWNNDHDTWENNPNVIELIVVCYVHHIGLPFKHVSVFFYHGRLTSDH